MAHHGLTQSAGDVVHKGRNRRMVYRPGGGAFMVGGVRPPRPITQFPRRQLGPPGAGPNLQVEFRHYETLYAQERQIYGQISALLDRMVDWIGQHFDFTEVELERLRTAFHDAEQETINPHPVHGHGTLWNVLAQLHFHPFNTPQTKANEVRNQILQDPWWQQEGHQLEFLGRDFNQANEAQEIAWQNYRKMWLAGNRE